jgi:hypothetical protein
LRSRQGACPAAQDYFSGRPSKIRFDLLTVAEEPTNAKFGKVTNPTDSAKFATHADGYPLMGWALKLMFSKAANGEGA